MSHSFDRLVGKVLVHRDLDLAISTPTVITELIPREAIEAAGSVVIVFHEFYHDGVSSMIATTNVGETSFANGFNSQSGLVLQIKDTICKRGAGFFWTREAARFNQRFVAQRIPGTTSQMFEVSPFPWVADPDATHLTYAMSIAPEGTMRLLTTRVVVCERAV